MKKVTLTSLLIIMAFLLPACGTFAKDVRNQASQVLRDASEKLAPEQSVTTERTEDELQQVLAPVPTATPGVPVVKLSEDSASLMSAYENAMTSIYDTVNPSV